DNKGRGMARKLGLEKVREINAKYMCMLDVGDYYYTNKLEWQFDYMENNRYVSLTSCNMGYIDNNLNLLGVQETVPKQQFFSFDNYSQYTPVPHASSIIRVSDIGDITFDEDLKLGQDQ